MDMGISPKVAESIRSIAGRPEDSAVLCDFDGCLAPIVNDPAASAVYPAALDGLRALAGRIGCLGVVSGRPVDFLYAAIGLEQIAYVGHHGLEHLVGGQVVLDPRAVGVADAVRRAADECESRLPGVLIERKGGVSVALHWRIAPELGAEAERVGREVAVSYGLAVLSGRCALELRPPIPVTKGDAVVTLASDHAIALFAGDDVTDLAAFDALDELYGSGALDLAVRVGVKSLEAVDELLDRSDIVVDGPEGLAELLVALADAIASEARY